ncbi:MAG: exodeoxyribonuclease 7 large subunit [Lysobacteraceae bacterium]|nr:MAG: exodeoxyribonuclease 7 large subunit [Xanthomonadaceae bacterium]
MPKPTLVYTPTHLNTEVRYLIENALGEVLVEGEIGNLSRPRSGHVYFSLRDESSEIRCALFARQARSVRVPMENGLKIQVAAQPTVYEVKGSYQLIVKRVLDAEQGSLAARFEKLKSQLAAEGLFSTERKKAVKQNCRRVAVVTSPDGAAVHDVIETLRRRMPLTHVRIYATQVAGANAASQVAAALTKADTDWADVILLVRGGGSLEDLWTFNEEQVARTLFSLKTPVVTGIGHQTDLSIADMVADLRADTPTAAAEQVSLNQVELTDRLSTLNRQLTSAVQRRFSQHGQVLDQMMLRLERLHPNNRIILARQRLDSARSNYRERTRALLHTLQQRLRTNRAKLDRLRPNKRISQVSERLRELKRSLDQSMRSQLHGHQERLTVANSLLTALSPQATLDRGYAYLRTEDGQIVRDQTQVCVNQLLDARLARGQLQLRVTDNGAPMPDSADD